MFALIIAVVAIVLTVAIAAATSYYGGDSLTQGRAKAEAAAFVTGAQQISGAAVMHLAMESENAASIQELIDDGYLTGVPVVKDGVLALNTETKLITSLVASEAVCAALNQAAGFGEAVAGVGVEGEDGYVAAVDGIGEDGTVAGLGDKSYGCVLEGTDKVFTFKY